MQLPKGTLDLFDYADARLAQLHRVAADTVRHDPHFPPEERERRAQIYERQAEALEKRQ